ncbi:MAG: type II toxin-antitoxin system HicB family antitoxin [Dehalococcoidia bacterium]
MARSIQLTAVIEREDKWYVALCPEYGVASQGRTVASARRNLTEALEGLFAVAGQSEIEARTVSEFYVTGVEVTLPGG